MFGTVLNAVGIVIGGMLGLMLTRQFSPSMQAAARGLIGIVTVMVGLSITWTRINGTPLPALKQVAIMILAMITGRLMGKLLRIQSSLNKLGQYANNRFKSAKPEDPNRTSDGFIICALLFCAGPLGPIGAVQEGLLGYWHPLAIKAVMDGLAAMGFVGVFGWGVVLSAIPVLAYQGTITLLVHRLEPFLNEHHLLDSVGAVGGLLVFCVALIVMELKKLELADYLPSLAMAPLITWLWR
jgi:uncharacterized membrane protein YqgA involved in biofilm formation